MKKGLFAFLLGCAVLSCGGCMENPKCLNGKEGVFAVMETSKGEIVLELYYKETPLTVTNFVGLAEGTLDAASGKHFYDGLKFHRVIANFMIQGGDPAGTGAGGPGYKFADEIVDDLKFTGPGVLAMANAGAGTNGSQFFITHVDTPWLNGHHTIFGHVVDDDSQKVVNKIAQGDVIKSVRIIRLGEDAKNFVCTQKEWDLLNEEVTRKATAAREAKMAAKVAEVEKKFPGFKKTAEGIYYKTTKAGSGEKCGAGKMVAVAYKGYLVDGTVFDASEGRGDLEFGTGAGQMIPGFDMMVQDMQKGERRTMVLPPELAYGERGYPGVIPENAYIAFDVTLDEIK